MRQLLHIPLALMALCCQLCLCSTQQSNVIVGLRKHGLSIPGSSSLVLNEDPFSAVQAFLLDDTPPAEESSPTPPSQLDQQHLLEKKRHSAFMDLLGAAQQITHYAQQSFSSYFAQLTTDQAVDTQALMLQLEIQSRQVGAGSGISLKDLR